MNIADGIALAVVLLFTLLGFRKGLAGQIAPLLTILITATVAYFAYTPCRTFLIQRSHASEAFASFAACVLVVVVPFAVVMLIRSAASGLLRIPVIGWVDRIGGAVAGFVGSALVVLAAFFLVNIPPPPYRVAAMGKESLIGRRVVGLETNLVRSVEERMERTEDRILKAREAHTGRREKWEE